MTGLFAFFYGTLHFLTYVVGDRFASLDFPDGFVALSTVRNLLASIWEDIAKRPYITVGFIAFSSMIPLALTSTTGWIRRLGGRNWQRLHRLIYLTGIAGVTHYWWKVKADTLHPAIYAAIVALLLGFRVVISLKRSRLHRQPIHARA
jgi:sulfoxide reductase heme-binding subunit YedZ